MILRVTTLSSVWTLDTNAMTWLREPREFGTVHPYEGYDPKPRPMHSFSEPVEVDGFLWVYDTERGAIRSGTVHEVETVKA